MKRKTKMEGQELLAGLYELYEQKMYAAAYAVLHSVEQAEDAVHDSFLKLVPYLDMIDKPSSIKTKGLVMKVLKTTAIDQYRKNHQDSERLTTDEAAAAQSQMKIMPIQSYEDQNFIRKLLEELPQDYLDVIKLRCYYGFSSRETADILLISPANVDKRMQRARKQISDKLNEEESEYERKEIKSDLKTAWKRSAGRTI